MSTFRGMQSFVPKLAFIAVEIELPKPPIWGILEKLGFFTKSWNIFSG